MSARASLLLLPLVCFGALAAEPAPPGSLDELLGQVRAIRSEQAKQDRERERRFLAEEGLQRQRLQEVRAALEAERRRGAD
ncbi:MAG: hypothetical protein P8Y25_08155, partial [Chromatiaceae bacterium]